MAEEAIKINIIKSIFYFLFIPSDFQIKYMFQQRLAGFKNKTGQDETYFILRNV